LQDLHAKERITESAEARAEARLAQEAETFVAKRRKVETQVRPKGKGELTIIQRTKPRSKFDPPALPPKEDLKAEQARARDADKPPSPRKPAKPSKPKEATTVGQKLAGMEADVRAKGKAVFTRFRQDVANVFSKEKRPRPKTLTSPAIGALVGENINKEADKKAQARKERVKKGFKAGVKGGAILTGLFTALEAGEAAAKEHDPKKRMAAAKKQAKKTAPETAKSIALYTAVSAAAAKIPGIAGTAATIGLHKVIPAVLTYQVGKKFTIPKIKELGRAVEGAYTAKREAREEKTASEARWGNEKMTNKERIKLATKTRHAKKSYQKMQKQKDLLVGK